MTHDVDDPSVSEVLAGAWQHWAEHCERLTDDDWATPTRCRPWDITALVAHLVPDPGMFDEIERAAVSGPPAVGDAAEVLRHFNAPGGVAHTMADDLAAEAVERASTLTPSEIVDRFATCSERVRHAAMSPDTVVPHPVVGSTTLAVMAEIALMEATVHHLDLVDAVGGEPMPRAALDRTRDLLARVADAASLIDVLAGRRPPDAALPVVR